MGNLLWRRLRGILFLCCYSSALTCLPASGPAIGTKDLFALRSKPVAANQGLSSIHEKQPDVGERYSFSNMLSICHAQMEYIITLSLLFLISFFLVQLLKIVALFCFQSLKLSLRYIPLIYLPRLLPFVYTGLYTHIPYQNALHIASTSWCSCQVRPCYVPPER